jgi:hypothetical protein
MTILTTLALMTSAVVAKLHESSDVEATRLQAKVDEFERKVADVERDLAALRLECDRWRASDFRPPQLLARTPELDEEFRAQQQTRALMAYAQQQTQAQQMQAQAQQMQMQMNQQYLGGLAQQSSQGAYEGFCNCVPARHDMFLPR